MKAMRTATRPDAPRRIPLTTRSAKLATTLAVASLAAAACSAPSAPAPAEGSVVGSAASHGAPVGTVSATRAAPSVASSAPIIRAYEFPGGMIEDGGPGIKLYTRVEALVALPQTPGRHPVAVVIHGSHPSCIDATRDQLITSEALTTPWPEGCGSKRSINDQAITQGPDYLRTPASMAYLARALAEKALRW